MNKISRKTFIKTSSKLGLGTMLSISILPNLRCGSPEPEMPKRVLGKTGLEVSLLGFGCVQVKDRMAYRQAIDCGINYFHMGDRDPTYNLVACEELIPYRKKVHVAYMSHRTDSKDIYLKDLDNFLKESRLGYLDVWFVICPGPEELNAFEEAAIEGVKAGKIRYTGITSHALKRDVEVFTSSDSSIDVVMMAYNYLSPPEHVDILDRFSNAGLGITPMKPLAGKFFGDNASDPSPLLRWVVKDERVHTLPVMMTSADQVRNNKTAIMNSYFAEDEARLKEQYAYHSCRFCRMCGSCEGICPRGMAVSDLVRTAMYVEGYKDVAMAKANFTVIPKVRRQITCADCSQCQVSCPNGVAIKDRLLALNDSSALDSRA